MRVDLTGRRARVVGSQSRHAERHALSSTGSRPVRNPRQRRYSGSILTGSTKTLFYSEEARRLSESVTSLIPLGRPDETRDIANAAVFLASDDASYITGHVLVVDGGWNTGFGRKW